MGGWRSPWVPGRYVVGLEFAERVWCERKVSEGEADDSATSLEDYQERRARGRRQHNTSGGGAHQDEDST